MQTQTYQDRFSQAERRKTLASRMTDRLPVEGSVIIRLSNNISHDKHFGSLRLYFRNGVIVGGAVLKEGVYPTQPYAFHGKSRMALADWLCCETSNVLWDVDQYHEIRVTRNNAQMWVDGHSILPTDFLVG